VIATGLDAVLPLLACPHCARPVTRQQAGTIGCGNGHRFDIARQGYLSLLGKGSRTDTGDSADMVEARSAFLGAGHYEFIAAEIASRVTAGPVLEIGAGTGYYLGMAVQRLRDNGSGGAVGLALDASRYAARRAAAQDGIGSVVADAWARLPVLDGVVPTVLSVFAPRDPAEITRVLAPGGRLIVVTPMPDHLAELRSALGLLVVDAGKPERLLAAFDGLLRPVERAEVRTGMMLTRDDLSALVRMGPSARHISLDRLADDIAALPGRTAVTAAVTVSVLAR
jgi:23S rRNA (guanine745-N1)-methyltransferase